MKKFTLLLWAMLFTAFSFAQTQLPYSSKKSSGGIMRCGTMERVEVLLKNNPQLRALAEQLSKIAPTGRTGDTYRTAAIVNVPVVFHIVLPNPYLVSDAVAQSQLDELNTDFSGLNADSTNGVNWYPVRGHSQIRFVMARRNPAGTLTNGINRIVSNTGSNINLAVDPIKRSSSGGADAWDPASYLNVWVGNDASGMGILGYAQFPGTGSAVNDGIFCNFQSFGISPCNIAIYNKGRTLGHEVGHYFGLLHIWGDENGCTGDDFRAIPGGSTCVLPASLYNPPGQGNTASDIGDTPNQAGATTNCPVGVVADACSPSKMYQNYMDYTADNCYSLFTNKQVQRMEYVIDNCRASLKTSLGGTPPAGAITLDASAFEPVNPGGSEVTGCSSTTYPSVIQCPGSFVPKVRIRNNGINTINTVTVGYTVNNGAPVTVNISPNLQFGNTLVVTFPSIAVTTGTYNFKYFTSNPNGTQPDQVPANDTLSATLTVSAGTPLPIFQGFETAPFPPVGWTIFNPNNNFTWVRVTPGHNSNNSMAIDNYNNNNPGQIDELRTPKLIFTPPDSVIITFDVAHKNYPGLSDILSVLISSDCGQTFTSVYSKSGPTLATAGSSTAAYVAPANTDWRTERIALGGANIAAGNLIIAFRNTNAYGNNIFIDNINISQQVSRDIKPEAIISPHPVECGTAIVPQIVVRNVGSAAVTAFKVGYSLNGGANVITPFTQTIAPGASATVTLPVMTANVGSNTFKVFTADPVTATGTGDQALSNDTTTTTFTVVTLLNTPLVEGFEGPAFPPAGWTVINPTGTIMWVRKTPGHNSTYSAFIDNYNNASGAIEDLKTPAINVANADSVVFSFDIAYRPYSLTAFQDTLQILVSTDCGNTYTSVYKKWGANLATGPVQTTAYNTPTDNEWRRDRIAVGGVNLSSGNVIFLIRDKSRFGNNIFIDNINIDKLVGRDLTVVSINQPSPISCASAISATATIKNVGYRTITDFKVSYSVDNGAAQTTQISGVSLAQNQTIDVTLTPTFTPTPGVHTITVYSWDPVASNGTGDQNTSNDTLSKTFTAVGNIPAPVFEGFESTTFPPTNWAIDNPDGLITWERTTSVAKSGIASAVIRNFDYTAFNTIDKLASPVITGTSVFDSVFVSFDLAYSQGLRYPGSTDLGLDTLELQLTKDCGATFTTIWKKWGEDLQTVSDPNYASGSRFTPRAADWMNIKLFLSPFVGTGNFQLYFVAKSNKQNNLYIDNINISGKTLPQRLKNQGYLIYPSPFTSTFRIHHFQVPTNLQSVGVYNSVGQRVWEKVLNGQANTEMTVNLGNLAGGVYIVKLNYLDKTVVERIVKR